MFYPGYIIAHKVLEQLKNSKYKDHIDAMVQAFEKTVKYWFRNEGQVLMLKAIHSTDISPFFDAPVQFIIDSVKEIRATSRKTFTVRHLPSS